MIIDKDNIIKSLNKTGGTPFEFKNIEVDIKGTPFISKSALNAMLHYLLIKT